MRPQAKGPHPHSPTAPRPMVTWQVAVDDFQAFFELMAAPALPTAEDDDGRDGATGAGGGASQDARGAADGPVRDVRGRSWSADDARLIIEEVDEDAGAAAPSAPSAHLANAGAAAANLCATVESGTGPGRRSHRDPLGAPFDAAGSTLTSEDLTAPSSAAASVHTSAHPSAAPSGPNSAMPSCSATLHSDVTGSEDAEAHTVPRLPTASNAQSPLTARHRVLLLR